MGPHVGPFCGEKGYEMGLVFLIPKKLNAMKLPKKNYFLLLNLFILLLVDIYSRYS